MHNEKKGSVLYQCSQTLLSLFCVNWKTTFTFCEYTLSNIQHKMLRIQPAELHQGPGANIDF